MESDQEELKTENDMRRTFITTIVFGMALCHATNALSQVPQQAESFTLCDSLSSNLNSAASAFTTDFYRRLRKGKRELLCGKVCTVAVGLFGGAGALALANADIGNIYDQFQRFLGILTGGLGCLFFMGVFMRRVDGFGATCGLVANYLVCFTLDLVPWSGKPHLLLYGFLGMAAALVVAPLASALRRLQKSGGGTRVAGT